jgi:hypothetical protein
VPQRTQRENFSVFSVYGDSTDLRALWWFSFSPAEPEVSKGGK